MDPQMQTSKYLSRLIVTCTFFISSSQSTEVFIQHERPSIIFHKTYTFDYCINDGNHKFACTQKTLSSNRDFLISVPYSVDSDDVLKLLNFKLNGKLCSQPDQINIPHGQTHILLQYKMSGACDIQVKSPAKNLTIR